MTGVAVLFARRDSVYKRFPCCDVWDADRDARTWGGGCPVIAHPPCRAWGRLRGFAKPRQDEPGLALWAVDQVRRFGGVLEHPEGSALWRAAGLPMPGQVDVSGGWTLPAPQFWWGHRAEKRSWFYIVGVRPGDLPKLPFVLGDAPRVISSSLRKGDLGWRPGVSRAEREKTPIELARWLVSLASIAEVPR